MGGRIYDPAIARFLTADPLVSRPWRSQAYNRYSYVENSPLAATDPSGLCDGACGDDEEEPDDPDTGDLKPGEWVTYLGSGDQMVFSSASATNSQQQAKADDTGEFGPLYAARDDIYIEIHSRPSPSKPEHSGSGGKGSSSKAPTQESTSEPSPSGNLFGLLPAWVAPAPVPATIRSGGEVSGGSGGGGASQTAQSVANSLMDTYAPGAHYVNLAQEAFAEHNLWYGRGVCGGLHR